MIVAWYWGRSCAWYYSVGTQKSFFDVLIRSLDEIEQVTQVVGSIIKTVITRGRRWLIRALNHYKTARKQYRHTLFPLSAGGLEIMKAFLVNAEVEFG